MTIATRNPSLAQLLNAFRARVMADIRVSTPGKIVRWDPATQLADVAPQVWEQLENEAGDLEAVRLPVVCNVPVQFPGAGGLRITFPVAVGDTCLLVFTDRSLDAWLANGGEQAPDDTRRHHLSDAVAFLGIHPNGAAWGGVEAGVMTLGSSSGASEFVATADRVLTELNKLRTAFNAHTHTVAATGLVSAAAGSPVTGAATASAPSAAPAHVAPASATVKIRG